MQNITLEYENPAV